LRMMIKEGPLPNIDTYYILMDGYVKCRDIRSAREIFDGLEKNGFHQDRISYSIMINGYVRERNLTQVYDLAARMSKEEIAASSYIHANTLHGLSITGQYSLASSAYNELKQAGIPLNIVICTTMLFSCARNNDFQGVLRIYNDINDMNLKIKMDDYTYNALIYAYGNNGDLKTCLQLYEEMGELNITRSIHTFNALLNSFTKKRDIQGVYQVLEMLKETGCKPTIGTYTIMMKIASLEGQCENIFKFLSIICKDASVKFIDNYTIKTAFECLKQHEEKDLIKKCFSLLTSSEIQRTKKISLKGSNCYPYFDVLLGEGLINEAKQCLHNLFTNKDKPSDIDIRIVGKTFKDAGYEHIWQDTIYKIYNRDQLISLEVEDDVESKDFFVE
jgi:pentatricopeptide repeat protein